MSRVDPETVPYSRENIARHIEELEKAAYYRGYDEGVKNGIRMAFTRLRNFLRNFIDLNDQTSGDSRSQPEPESQLEPETLDTLPPNGGSQPLSDRSQRAVDYVKNHPGTTAAASEEVVGRNTLYRLAQKGLIRKEGTQFYPLDAG